MESLSLPFTQTQKKKTSLNEAAVHAEALNSTTLWGKKGSAVAKLISKAHKVRDMHCVDFSKLTTLAT